MIYSIGAYIRNRRKELGITQNELAAGLCSVMTISRIERGEQIPQDSTLKSILQRLGLSGAELMFANNADSLLLHQLKYDIRQASILEDYARADRILTENKDWISGLEPLDKQTFETAAVLLKILRNELTDKEALNQLEALIRITCPKYTKDKPPTLMTYDEILLLNNIALKYAHLGDVETAISLLYHIKDFYDKRNCDIEETLRTEPMVLYNLSKYLGLAGRIDESIEISSQGIRLAKQTRRCSVMAKTLYNMAYGLYERNKPGDRDTSLHYVKQAYYLADILDMKQSKEHYKNYISAKFGEQV